MEKCASGEISNRTILIVKSPKSVVQAVMFTVVMGPVGLVYVNYIGAFIMTGITILIYFLISDVWLTEIWLCSIAWSCIEVISFNMNRSFLQFD